MQIYANLFKINEKCYFSVISWPILILFVLSDRAWCGLQNFYTILKFINYACNLFKINELHATKSLVYFLADFDSNCLFYLIGLGAPSLLLHRILISFINYANLFKIKEKCYFSVISWPILILFVLSDRAWCGLQYLYKEFLKFINYANLCKFIQNQWNMPPLLSPLFRNHNRSALEAGMYITHRVIYYPLVFPVTPQFQIHLTLYLKVKSLFCRPVYGFLTNVCVPICVWPVMVWFHAYFYILKGEVQ